MNELCSSVIVGDIDVDFMEENIQQHLSDWQNDSRRTQDPIEVPIKRPHDRIFKMKRFRIP